MCGLTPWLTCKGTEHASCVHLLAVDKMEAGLEGCVNGARLTVMSKRGRLQACPPPGRPQTRDMCKQPVCKQLAPFECSCIQLELVAQNIYVEL